MLEHGHHCDIMRFDLKEFSLKLYQIQMKTMLKYLNDGKIK